MRNSLESSQNILTKARNIGLAAGLILAACSGDKPENPNYSPPLITAPTADQHCDLIVGQTSTAEPQKNFYLNETSSVDIYANPSSQVIKFTLLLDTDLNNPGPESIGQPQIFSENTASQAIISFPITDGQTARIDIWRDRHIDLSPGDDQYEVRAIVCDGS